MDGYISSNFFLYLEEYGQKRDKILILMQQAEKRMMETDNIDEVRKLSADIIELNTRLRRGENKFIEVLEAQEFGVEFKIPTRTNMIGDSSESGSGYVSHVDGGKNMWTPEDLFIASAVKELFGISSENITITSK